MSALDAALEWTVEHLEMFRPEAPDGAVVPSRMKGVIELGIMTHAYTDLSGDRIDPRVGSVVDFLRSVQADARVTDYLFRSPRHFIVYATLHAVLRKLGHEDFLVQGTLYPDVIESVSVKGPSAVIKSHHNVGGLPEKMNLKLIEPLRELFKDEVRRVGTELGLPDEIVWRQPFPGPGLAIRIIGEVTEERLEILRHADAVIREEIRRAGLEREIWQAFAVLPAIKSVGVMGDARTYEYPIILRAVTSEDAMTADWARLPYDLLERISSRVINEVAGVNRVALDISSKPPGTIEWE